MCGIGGVLAFADGVDSGPTLRAMSASMSHRGPDGEGFLQRDRVGLLHRRLSIIDVGGGAQPMSNEDGTVWISFNGEIYNFRELREQLEGHGHAFRTASDTEVVVHAYEQWGEQCVTKLNGMFAFAIWDERRGELFLARDRVGIKPLVYWHGRDCFAFASELQALRAIPALQPTTDLAAVDLYLHFQYIPAPYTVYAEVRKLPPACTLTVDRNGQLRGPRRYWNLEFRAERALSEEEWCRRLDHELREAVRRQTVSDVPFGAFLSGGADSSTVVAYMSEVLKEPVRTFSIGFAEDEYDETGYARQVAGQLGTLHFEERVTPEGLDVLPRLVRHYGEPFADSSAVPTYYLSRVAAAHVKMVLSGDGGDENFAGYRTYQSTIRQRIGPADPVRRARFMAGAILRAMHLRPQLPSALESWYGSVAYFNDAARASLWRPEYATHIPQTRAWMRAQFTQARQPDLCSHLQKLDIATYLPNDILTKVDIASMMNSLEVRVPLLDHELMEMVATIPPALKWRRGSGKQPDTGKYILKKTAQRFFTPEFLNRKKMGFEVPIRSWFAGESRAWIRERLLAREGALGAWFEPAAIERLLSPPGGEQPNHLRVWSLLVLQEWLQQNAERGGRLAASA
jgi:asparagine synthase (glutamine-hydrolysing)